MKATIKTENGHTCLIVEYGPVRLNWDEAIAGALASYGIQRHQLATIIAKPVKTAQSHNNNPQLPLV